jgi:hypothetical protein
MEKGYSSNQSEMSLEPGIVILSITKMHRQSADRQIALGRLMDKGRVMCDTTIHCKGIV